MANLSSPTVLAYIQDGGRLASILAVDSGRFEHDRPKAA
jgi:hypothetical protein